MNEEPRGEQEPEVEAVEQAPEPEPTAPETEEDGLTPKGIVEKYQRMLRRDMISRSRSGVADRVRVDLAAYHERRGWGEPTLEQVMELVREIM